MSSINGTVEITASELRERDRVVMSDGSLAAVRSVMPLPRGRVFIVVCGGPMQRLRDAKLPRDARVRVAADRPEPVAVAQF